MSSTSGNVPTVVYYCLGDIYSTNNPLLTVLEGDLVTQTLVSSEKAMTLTGAVQWDKVTRAAAKMPRGLQKDEVIAQNLPLATYNLWWATIRLPRRRRCI